MYVMYVCVKVALLYDRRYSRTLTLIKPTVRTVVSYIYIDYTV